MAAPFHSYFDIQSTPAAKPSPTAPQKARSKPHHAPSALELDELAFGKKYTGPTSGNASGTQTPVRELPPDFHPQVDTITPATPNELEMSRPPSPDAVGVTQRWNNPPINKWRILSCSMIYLCNGLNDSATGALIPYLEKYYRIGYAVVSMVFVGQAAGFIVAAFFNDMTLQKLGRAKTLILAELILLGSYIILVCTPPYPVVVIAFFMLGYGAAITLALNNVFCANLQPSSAVLGFAHGSYSVGGIIAPIAATSIAAKGVLWSRFYFLPLGLAFLCMSSAGWTFWGFQEELHPPLLVSEQGAAPGGVADRAKSKLRDLKTALHNRVTIFGALFIFAYQGAEVSISGWVISFLINYRNGDPASVGYVTSGFWGGITLGRFALTHLAPRLGGERLFVTLLILGTSAFQLLAWLVPNIITNAVAVSILGLLLGPVYPCAQTIFSKLLPRHVQTTAIGFISGAGSSGGAVAPFTTGILAQVVGTWVLHPVCVGLYVGMLGCWFGLPRVGKRRE